MSSFRFWLPYGCRFSGSRPLTQHIAPIVARTVAGAVSLLGMSLPRLFQAQTAAREIGLVNAAPRAKACILLFMWGGPAQQDTWDMKPAAPAEYRGMYQPIGTSVPGIVLSERLPHLIELS